MKEEAAAEEAAAAEAVVAEESATEEATIKPAAAEVSAVAKEAASQEAPVAEEAVAEEAAKEIEKPAPAKTVSNPPDKRHIEVEDDVSCYMEFPDGASGLFLTSTGETPGSNRLEIAGTKGRLLLENDRLMSRLFQQNRPSFWQTLAQSMSNMRTCSISCVEQAGQ